MMGEIWADTETATVSKPTWQSLGESNPSLQVENLAS